MKKYLICIAAASTLGACQTKIDTDSPQDYIQSVAKVTEGMSPVKKAEFRDALIAITFDASDPSEGIWANSDATSPIFLSAGDKIDAKGADDIIRLGYETRIAALDREIAESLDEVKRQNSEREKHKTIFDNIHIDGARYHVSDNGFMREPLISFRITNNSRMPLKSIYLHGVLASPGRSIPWVSEDVNYEFGGGLEPGESENLDLSPNMFGEWKIDEKYSRRPDLKLSLDLVNVEGPDGQTLLQGDFADVEAKQVDAASKQKMRDDLALKMAAL